MGLPDTDRKAMIQKGFDTVAPGYDHPSLSFFPETAKRLVEYLNLLPDQHLLDICTGTGCVALEAAQKLTRGKVTGIDLSTGMLEQARKKNVYSKFHQVIMGDPLGFPSDCFDAVISVGVLTEGHAPADSLDELVRITKSGGYIIYTLRTDLYEGAGFREKNENLEKAGKWTLVEKGAEIQALPKGEPGVYLKAWVFSVT